MSPDLATPHVFDATTDRFETDGPVDESGGEFHPDAPLGDLPDLGRRRGQPPLALPVQSKAAIARLLWNRATQR